MKVAPFISAFPAYCIDPMTNDGRVTIHWATSISFANKEDVELFAFEELGNKLSLPIDKLLCGDSRDCDCGKSQNDPSWDKCNVESLEPPSPLRDR